MTKYLLAFIESLIRIDQLHPKLIEHFRYILHLLDYLGFIEAARLFQMDSAWQIFDRFNIFLLGY